MYIALFLMYIINLIHNSHGKNPTVKTDFNWPLKPNKFYNIKLENNVGPDPLVLFKIDKMYGCYRLKNPKKDKNMDGLRFKTSDNLDITKEFAGRISFESKYNRQQFQMYYFKTPPCSSCAECLKKVDSDSLIYEHKLKMAKKYSNIDLKVKVLVQGIENNNKKYFNVNSSILVYCIGTDGLSSIDPVLTLGDGKNEFNEAKLNKNIAKLLDFHITKKVKLLKEYHNKEVRCSVPDLNQSKVYKLTVNHPPTKTKLSIPYKGFIRNGAKVKCSSKDGYPKSEASWSIKLSSSGFRDKKEYEINPNNTLKIDKNAPIYRNVTFRCNLKYKYPDGGYSYIHQDYNFIIGEPTHITKITVKPVSLSSINVSWEAPEKNTFEEYSIILKQHDKTKFNLTTKNKSVKFNKLKECTKYCVTVTTMNYGVTSAVSEVFCERTFARGGGHFTFDITFGNIQNSTCLEILSRNISWSHSNEKCVEFYNLYIWKKNEKNNTKTAETNETFFYLPQLPSSTLFEFQVEAKLYQTESGDNKVISNTQSFHTAYLDIVLLTCLFTLIALFIYCIICFVYIYVC